MALVCETPSACKIMISFVVVKNLLSFRFLLPILVQLSQFQWNKVTKSTFPCERCVTTNAKRQEVENWLCYSKSKFFLEIYFNSFGIEEKYCRHSIRDMSSAWRTTCRHVQIGNGANHDGDGNGNVAKQKVLNLCTFLCRPLQNNNVKWPCSMYFGEREPQWLIFGIFRNWNAVGAYLAWANF